MDVQVNSSSGLADGSGGLTAADVESALLGRGSGRMVPNRDRIIELLDMLGNPQRSYPAIHLTGTNGKTSAARMIDALLRAHDLRTGRYTSPHLDSVTERICIDGVPLSDEQFAAAYQEVAPLVALIDEQERAAGKQTVTYFEFVTAMAFAAFADAPVEAAIVEVGLGGRWDATNVLDATVAVVSPIGLDHADVLGPTIADIATEKAGIIHRDATVIMTAQPAEAVPPLLHRVAEMEATVAREGAEFGVVDRQLAVGGQRLTIQGLGGVYDDIFLPLFGAHQAQNASLALAAVEAFLGAGKSRSLELDIVREGFAQASSPGRLEAVRASPTIVVDAAHNPEGLRATLAAFAESFAFRRVIAVLGVLGNKDAVTMVELLEPVADQIVITENSSPRRFPADDLAAIAVDVFGADRVEVAPRLDDALEAAVRMVEENGDQGSSLAGGGVLVTGSVVTAADARRLLRR